MASNWRNLTVGERHIRTTVPASVDLFENAAPDPGYDPTRAGYLLNPGKLDELQPGSYHVKTRLLRHSVVATLTNHRQTITVRQAEHGLVVAEASFGHASEIAKLPKEQYRAVRPLLQRLGHVCAENGAVEIATPQTLKRTAAQNGLLVRLLNTGLIDIKTYLETFADGEFPMGIAEEKYYNHDNGDAHATGMLLGGVVLRDTLQIAAGGVLRKGTKLDEAATVFDNYSYLVRQASVYDGIDNTQYFEFYDGAKSATEAVVNEGKRVGIPEQASMVVVESARSAAANMGVPVPV